MAGGPNHFDIRPDWLATQDEPALDPALPIVDAHHHLYERPGLRYLLQDYLADVNTGHNLRASVFVQARAMLPEGVAPQWQPVGEVEFVNGVAAMSASGIYGSARVCAGIVGFADLTLGDAVRPVLERLIQAGGGTADTGGRFRGIRQTLCWDEDTAFMNPAYPTTPDMIDSHAFRAGFAHLAALGLSFEAWAFFHQLEDVARLARAFPDVPIVLNHVGGILRVRGYEGHPEVYSIWRSGIDALAACPNVVLKLSGLGMRISGFRFEEVAVAPSSATLAEAWAPWVLPCLEAFGPARCMYGSNFPVDKGAYGFKIGLNALKRLVSDGRDDVFWRTAARTYRLPDGLLNRSLPTDPHQ